MGNLVTWITRLWSHSKLELAVLGLENAGKSTLVQIMAGNILPRESVPTVGFNMEQFIKGNVIIKVWDLAGSARFRSMWPRYVRGVHAVIFVVDSADIQEFPTVKHEIHEIFSRTQLTDIPLLVVANKSDLPGAASEESLFDILDLKSLSQGREVSVLSTSCKTHQNIDRALEFLVKHSE
uniref:Uncharacterized protein n=1 Tax=Spongospora subterranea TaxID=70186 RepID=A0A0H5RLN1_9EUKA|eukprot:CRZ09639.1 hypothetical protein [Spongospora subterranea]